MKVLFVAPWAPTEVRARGYEHLEILRRAGYSVTVLFPSSPQNIPMECPPGDAITYLPVRTSRVERLFRLLGALLRRNSLQQAYFLDRRISEALQQQVSTGDFDVIFFNVIRTATALHGISTGDALLVLDMDDVRSTYYDQLRRQMGHIGWRVLASIEYPRMLEAEDRAFDEFDRVLVSSPKDHSVRGRTAIVARTPVHIRHLEEPSHGTVMSTAKAAPTIVFVGRMSYEANVQAVLWFAHNVMPRIWRSRENVRFSVVGENPTRKVRSLGKADKRIEVLGGVPDVRPYYSSADVSVVPVNLGSGVQMKLLEGFVLEVPTVTTPMVADAAGVSADSVAIAESADEWAEAVIWILDHPEEAAARGARAKTWADVVYSEQAIAENFLRALEP